MKAENEEIKKKIAYLEFVNCQIIDELLEADELLRRVGFEEGLQTVKSAAVEIIEFEGKEEGDLI